MKRILLLLSCAIFLLTNVSKAQQRINNQDIIKASGGIIVNNIGYVATLGYEKQIKLTNNSIYLDVSIRGQKYNTNLPYVYKVKKRNYELFAFYANTFYRNRDIYLNAMGGAFIGYESYHHSSPNIIIEEKNGVSAGIAAAMQVEYILCKEVNLYFQPTLLYNIASNTENIRFLTSIGVKYYF